MSYIKQQWFLMISLLLLFVCHQDVGGASVTKYPVILVPGDGGSRIEAKLDKSQLIHSWCAKKTHGWFPLWLNLKLMVPYAFDCLAVNMRLIYDVKTHTTRNSPGVETRIPGFGNTSSVEWLSYYHFKYTEYFYGIVQYLVDKFGYVRNVNVRAAPFDFRKAPNEMGKYFTKLRNLIEDTYHQNNNTKVVLLGHSMGSTYTLYMLNQQSAEWKDRYVKSFVSLAGPWGGSVKLLWVMASGTFYLYPLAARSQERTMTSSAWLLPYDTFWNASEVLVQSPTYNYTVNDYHRFFKDINYTNGYLMRQDTEPLIKQLTPPGVEVHCLHGQGVQTSAKLIYSGRRWYHRHSTHWYDRQPRVLYGDGDGTVNLRSLLGCTRWENEQEHPVTHKVFKGAQHLDIMSDKRMLDYLGKRVLHL